VTDIDAGNRRRRAAAVRISGGRCARAAIGLAHRGFGRIWPGRRREHLHQHVFRVGRPEATVIGPL
jgi:hypothetical protein